MKLKESTFESQILGVEKEMTFEIESDNSIVFDILRDKMYSNKIGSICREVASNSRDANRDTGNEDTPIKITIAEPNQYVGISDMAIVFEDCGTGITPDRMEKVFLKYGASTKRDTNDRTGGYGLGAKTPFAYSDTFTVITVCDWEGEKLKYTYNAMIDSSRKGKMVLFDSEETEDQTGTQIIVPIDEADREDFERECYKATIFWETQPDYINFHTYTPIVKDLNEEIKIGDLILRDISDSYITNGDHKFVLLIDGIPYPISDMSLIGDYTNSFPGTILIPFNNGDVNIAANREAVQFDEETVERIREKLKGLDKYFIKLVKEWFKKQKGKTYIEIVLLMKDYRAGGQERCHTFEYPFIETLINLISSTSYDFVTLINKEWKKLESQFNIPIKTGTFFNHFNIKIIKPDIWKKKVTYIPSNKIIDIWKNGVFFIKGEKKLHKRKSEEAMSIASGTPEGGLAFVIEPPNFEKLDEIQRNKAIDEAFLMQDLLGLDIRFYDDIKYTRTKSSSSKGKTKSDKSSIDRESVEINSRVYMSGYWETKAFDYKYDWEMVELDKDSYPIDEICFLNIDKLTQWEDSISDEDMMRIELLWAVVGIKTIVVNNRSWKKYFFNCNYPILDEVFSLHKKVIRKQMFEYYQIRNNNYICDIVPSAFREREEFFGLSPLKWLGVTKMPLHSMHHNISDIVTNYTHICNRILQTSFPNNVWDRIIEEWDKFLSRYPLLKHLYEADHLFREFMNNRKWTEKHYSKRAELYKKIIKDAIKQNHTRPSMRPKRQMKRNRR